MTVSGRSASGKVVTLTLASGSTIFQSQTVTVSYADPGPGDNTAAVQDTSGNDAASFTDQPVTNNSTQVVDNTAPTLESAEVSASGLQLNVDFSETLDVSSETLSAAVKNSFSVTADGVSLAIQRIAVSGGSDRRNINIGFETGTTIYQGQTVKLSYNKTTAGSDALADEAGNEVATFTDFAVTNSSTADRTPPTLESSAVPANGRSVALTFNEDLKTANTDLPGVGAFTVKAAGTAVTVSGRSASGKVVTLTLASGARLYQGQTVNRELRRPDHRQRHRRRPGLDGAKGRLGNPRNRRIVSGAVHGRAHRPFVVGPADRRGRAANPRGCGRRNVRGAGAVGVGDEGDRATHLGRPIERRGLDVANGDGPEEVLAAEGVRPHPLVVDLERVGHAGAERQLARREGEFGHDHRHRHGLVPARLFNQRIGVFKRTVVPGVAEWIGEVEMGLGEVGGVGRDKGAARHDSRRSGDRGEPQRALDGVHHWRGRDLNPTRAARPHQKPASLTTMAGRA